MKSNNNNDDETTTNNDNSVITITAMQLNRNELPGTS